MTGQTSGLRPNLGAALLLAGLTLAGCGNFKEQLGIERRAPDEFTVVSRPPLSLPPDYSLRPPRPGERRPQEPLVREQARNVLLSSSTAGGSFDTRRSSGETALLAHAATDSADPEIRRLVGNEAVTRDDRNFIERMMFWIDNPPPGDVVNAPAESRRLQENAALGRPVTTGETPTIERKPANRGITLF